MEPAMMRLTVVECYSLCIKNSPPQSIVVLLVLELSSQRSTTLAADTSDPATSHFSSTVCIVCPPWILVSAFPR